MAPSQIPLHDQEERPILELAEEMRALVRYGFRSPADRAGPHLLALPAVRSRALDPGDRTSLARALEAALREELDCLDHKLALAARLLLGIDPSVAGAKLTTRREAAARAADPKHFYRSYTTAELDRIMTARPAATTAPRAREMNLYRRYFDLVANGTKTIEVRVQYPNLRNLAAGDHIRFVCGRDEALTRVKRVARYGLFEELLDTEGPEKVNSASLRDQQLANIRRIYGPEKEALGVLAIEPVNLIGHRRGQRRGRRSGLGGIAIRTAP
ncbi:ASCH domain-containing protein [Streptosporangium sp. NPDC002544]|uniref:ASCH domain-containing protein n=1 Tax=Streptosporangium sp. NPDC002544 TaxID=3154538 RepID=UPI0033256A7B